MNKEFLSLCCMLVAILIVPPGLVAAYEYTCEAEVDGRRGGVRTIAMYKEADGTFSGGLALATVEARQEGEVLVLSIIPVQNPTGRRMKRTQVPTGKDNPAKFTTRYPSGIWTIVCK